MATRITEHYFEYGVMKYFRENAHNVQIGSFGRKHDPIGARAYLEVEDHVNTEYLEGPVRYTTTASIDWSETTGADVGGNFVFKFFGLGRKGTLNADFGQAKAAKLQLMNIGMDEGPLKDMLNHHATAAREFLADKHDGRIVSEVWIVLEAELANHFSAYADASTSVQAFGSSVEVSAKGGRHGTQTISISPGTIFAYKLHKVTNWSKGKKQIEDMADDYKGWS